MKRIFFSSCVVFAVVILTACEALSGTMGKELIGVYVLDASSDFGPWQEQITITESSVRYESGNSDETLSVVYEAEIEKARFGSFNGGEQRPANSIAENAAFPFFGYLVIRLTKSDGDGTGKVGGYNVFRFARGEDNLWIFTQGFKNGSTDESVYVNSLFSDAAEAEEKITCANGWFDYASVGYEKQ